MGPQLLQETAWNWKTMVFWGLGERVAFQLGGNGEVARRTLQGRQDPLLQPFSRPVSGLQTLPDLLVKGPCSHVPVCPQSSALMVRLSCLVSGWNQPPCSCRLLGVRIIVRVTRDTGVRSARRAGFRSWHHHLQFDTVVPLFPYHKIATSYSCDY